jgi:signal-transduction protein with cAMP-binding, CBS, and nucleotidyltransferase domain
MYDSLKSFLQPFIQLSEEEFAFLTAHVFYKEYPKKQLLIQEGETEQHLYFINKGIVHQYFYKGEEMVTTDIVTEGTITGSVASFLSWKHWNPLQHLSFPGKGWMLCTKVISSGSVLVVF